MALTGGAHDAGEHLLSIGAVAGAVATTHLAGDDSGPNGLFGAPELVASTVRSRRKRNTASNSVVRCRAKRSASSSGGGASISFGDET